VPVLRLFGPAREAAGVAMVEVEGATVADVVASAVDRYGERFAAVAATCNVWVDAEPAGPASEVPAGAEVALLPPVSGG
jgi:molybdopterin converting factor small subunit